MEPGEESAGREALIRRMSSAPRAGTTLRFAVLFLLLVVAFAALGATPFASQVIHQPASHAVAVLASLPLSLLGKATVSGHELTFDGFRASIVEACNGVLPTAIYCAAVLAFPSGLKAKAWGLAIGIPAVQLVNLVRVASLMLFGAYWPALFERVHIFVWQTVVIGLSMTVWIFWVEAFVEPHGATEPKR